MSVWYNQLWGTFLGLEIMITGIVMQRISKKVRPQETPFFIKRFWNFFAIGFIVAVIGILFPLYTQYKICYAMPLYLLYGLYMLSATRLHIDEKNLKILIGKALY